MTLHLIKLCVGIDDVDHLTRVQAVRLRDGGVLRHVTRFAPRKAGQVAGQGSLYWVIRRFVQVRQPILGFDEVVTDDGQRKCGIRLSPTLIRTRAVPFRAFQGWRYLKPEDAPADILNGDAEAASGIEALPSAMAQELRELGLI